MEVVDRRNHPGSIRPTALSLDTATIRDHVMALSRLLEDFPDIRTALDEGMQTLLRQDPPLRGKKAVLCLAHELKRFGGDANGYSEQEAEAAVRAKLADARRGEQIEAERRAKSRQRSRRASAVAATEYTLPGGQDGQSDMEAAAAAAVAAAAALEGGSAGGGGEREGGPQSDDGDGTAAAAEAAAASLGGLAPPGGKPGRVSSGRTSEAGADDEVDEEEAARRRAAARRGKRRGSVFDRGAAPDEAWVPPVVEKSRRDWASILGHLATNSLFGGLAEEQRRVLAHAMEQVPFAAGEQLIRQGDVGDYYYLVATGRCDVFVQGLGKVLEVGQGAGFGELALLYDAPRAASVRGAVAGACWRLDRATFKQVVVGMTRRRRELNLGFVRGTDLFDSLSDWDRAAAADALLSVDVRAGDVVVREGEAAEGAGARMYIVERGELRAEREGLEGPACRPLTKGAYFGELALLGDGVRMATVTAVSDSRLLAMDRATLLRLLPPGGDEGGGAGGAGEVLRARLEAYGLVGGAEGGAAGGGGAGRAEETAGDGAGVEAAAEAGLAAASQEEGAREEDLVAAPSGGGGGGVEGNGQ